MIPTLQSLQDQLIDKFDMDYWNAKARMYAKLLEDKKLRKEILQRADPEDREFLLTELNATKIHCCETLMRLIIIARFKTTPLIPLMTLKQREYGSEIEKMNNNFELYFNGNSEKYFQEYFFPTLQKQVSQESATFMKKCVKKFLEELSNNSVYNVYKHGFYGSVSIQDDAKMTVQRTGEEYKIGHLINSFHLKKEFSKGGYDHVVIFEDHAIDVMRDRQIIDLATKFISNYYNVIRIGTKKPIKDTLYSFKNDDDELNSIFKFESFWKKVNMNFPFKMPSAIKKQFKIKT